jgi:hypothetical protein
MLDVAGPALTSFEQLLENLASAINLGIQPDRARPLAHLTDEGRARVAGLRRQLEGGEVAGMHAPSQLRAPRTTVPARLARSARATVDPGVVPATNSLVDSTDAITPRETRTQRSPMELGRRQPPQVVVVAGFQLPGRTWPK